MVRLVLFDIDGTLIRTHGAGVKAFAQTFASEFKPNQGVEQLKFAGRTDRSIVREFFVKNHIDPSLENFQRFFDYYVHVLDYLLSKSRGEICAGVWNFLHQLEALPKPPVIGLLTGNIRLGAEIKLRHYQLWESFSIGAFGDDHEDRNELSKIARQRATQFLGNTISGDQIVVVGDTSLDIACANSIQAKSLAVATGGATFEELQSHHPTWAVHDLNAVSAQQICS